MAAAISMVGGVAEMAYVGATPWHGLGNKLVEGASIETWKEAAGMNWMVKRSRVRFGDGDRAGIMEDKHVLFRSDTKAPLGIVSNKYKVVHPGEVLEFFRDLVADNGFVLNTAGVLFGGSRFWALAKIGPDASIVGADLLGQYLLLSTSCDGTLATTATPTTVCVVCNNTLTMALSAKSAQRVTIGHRSVFDPRSVKDRLGIATGGFGDFLAATRKLAAKQTTNGKAAEFIAQLLVDTKTVLGEDVRKSKQYAKIMGLFEGAGMGSELDSREGTMWGVVNAVTEFVDHHARAKETDNRLASAWFGRGDDLKTAAMERALTTI